MGVKVMIVQNVDAEKFMASMENNLNEFHNKGFKTDIKFTTSQLDGDEVTIYTAMIIASEN